MTLSAEIQIHVQLTNVPMQRSPWRHKLWPGLCVARTIPENIECWLGIRACESQISLNALCLIRIWVALIVRVGKDLGEYPVWLVHLQIRKPRHWKVMSLENGHLETEPAQWAPQALTASQMWMLRCHHPMYPTVWKGARRMLLRKYGQLCQEFLLLFVFKVQSKMQFVTKEYQQMAPSP